MWGVWKGLGGRGGWLRAAWGVWVIGRASGRRGNRRFWSERMVWGTTSWRRQLLVRTGPADIEGEWWVRDGGSGVGFRGSVVSLGLGLWWEVGNGCSDRRRLVGRLGLMATQ